MNNVYHNAHINTESKFKKLKFVILKIMRQQFHEMDGQSELIKIVFSLIRITYLKTVVSFWTLAITRYLNTCNWRFYP